MRYVDLTFVYMFRLVVGLAKGSVFSGVAGYLIYLLVDEPLAWYYMIPAILGILLCGAGSLFFLYLAIKGEDKDARILDRLLRPLPKAQAPFLDKLGAGVSSFAIFFTIPGFMFLGFSIWQLSSFTDTTVGSFIWVLSILEIIVALGIFRFSYGHYRRELFEVVRKHLLSENGVATLGQITFKDYDWSFQINQRPVNYHVYVRYSDAENNTYDVHTLVPYEDAVTLNVGESIALVYDKNYPKSFELKL